MFTISYNLIDIPASEKEATSSFRSTTVDLKQEQQLVEMAKKDPESFGKLYDYYFPKLYSFVAAKVYDRDEAEDLVSEIFTKVLENLHKFEWRGFPFGAWLFRIARNTLNDYYIRANKTRTVDIEEVPGIKEDETKTSPHKLAADTELSDKVKEILKDLPDNSVSAASL
jgi:RNA polymerase sigma-70 factor (ECF subfamily)